MDEYLVENLAVVIVEAWLSGRGQGEVIFVGITGQEGVCGQLVATGVAAGTVVLSLHFIERLHLCPLIAPTGGFDVRFEPEGALRAVYNATSDPYTVFVWPTATAQQGQSVSLTLGPKAASVEA